MLPSTGVAGAAAADDSIASSSSREEEKALCANARSSAQQQATAASTARRSRDGEGAGHTAPLPLYGTVVGESRGRFANLFASGCVSADGADASLLLSHGRRHVVPPSRRGDIGGFHGEEPAISVAIVLRVAFASVLAQPNFSRVVLGTFQTLRKSLHTICNRWLTIGLMS